MLGRNAHLSLSLATAWELALWTPLWSFCTRMWLTHHWKGDYFDTHGFKDGTRCIPGGSILKDWKPREICQEVPFWGDKYVEDGVLRDWNWTGELKWCKQTFCGLVSTSVDWSHMDVNGRHEKSTTRSRATIFISYTKLTPANVNKYAMSL